MERAQRLYAVVVPRPHWLVAAAWRLSIALLKLLRSSFHPYYHDWQRTADRRRPPRSGHDALHVRERGLQSAEDPVRFELAEREDRILISEDTDFGTLLAMRDSAKPSVILFRHMPDRSAASLSRILLANLSAVEADLPARALTVFESSRIRLRRLPIGRTRRLPSGAS